MTHPPSRAFRTRVRDVRRLTPHLTRVTVTDDELEHFGTGGLDQRIKLFLARPDGTMPDVGLFAEPRPTGFEWYHRWRELPDAERNPIRTYTVRAVRPQAREVDIDFVLHGAEGPASAWALGAEVGDELVIIGPDSRGTAEYGGIEWRPGDATRVLLAGDETALPAICGIVESLGSDVAGEAYVEVPTADDVLEVPTASRVTVRWLPRDRRAHGEVLDAAVRAWADDELGTTSGGTSATPDAAEALGASGDPQPILWEVPTDAAGSHYAWLAGESSVITGLRRHLVRDRGMDRRSVAFMGYWRRGRAEGS